MKITPFLICFLVLALNSQPAFSQQWQVLDKKFETLQAEKKYHEALVVAEKTIETAEKEFKIDSREYHKSLKNMAESYQGLEQWDNALEYYKELMRREISRIAKIDLTMSSTIQSIISLYGYLYDKKSATSVYQQATTRLSQLEQVDNTIYTELSDYYTRVVMSQAPPTVAQAVEMTSRLTGADLSSMNEYAAEYSQDKTIQQGQRQSPSSAADQGNSSLQQLVDTCAKNKQYSNFSGGIESCKELYDLRKKMGLQNTIEHARTCYDLGYFHMLSSKYQGSIEYYQEGIELWERNGFGKNEEYVEALYNVSASLQVNQEYDKGETLLLKAEKVAVGLDSNKNSLYPGILAMLAAIQRVHGDYAVAEKTYDRYRDYYRAKNDTSPAVWLNYYLGVGFVYEALGKWQEADRVYLLYNKASIDLINELFKYVTLSSEKKVALSFVGFKYNQDFYYSYCRKRKKHNPQLIDQMYNNELLEKGLVMRTLKRKTERILNSGDPRLISDFEQWLNVRKKLAKLSLLPVSDRRESAADLETKAAQLETSIQAKLLDGDLKRETLKLDWQDVQKKLLVNEAAIEFVKFQEFDINKQEWTDKILYGALIIRPGYEHPRLVNLFEQDEFQQFLDDTREPSPFEQVRRMYTWLPGKYNGQYKGDTLYKHVWSPLEPHLEGVKKIYYSPTGLLHKISFSAIPIAEKKTLIGKYNLQQLSSTGLLTEQRPSFYFSKEDQALLFGGILYDLEANMLKPGAKKQTKEKSELFIRDRSFDWTRSGSTGGAWPYLAGSLEEVRQIDTLLSSSGRKSQLMTREDALEERFKQTGKSHPAIIHIATHGFFFPSQREKKKERMVGLQANDQVDPDEAFKRSGLLFAGANNTWLGKHLADGLEDGVLTSYEISKLNLTKTKLVVLSACETGLGDLAGGEGVYGLQRAFKLAGVDNIIMSLWQIPDTQTAELMNSFYSQWLGGKDLHEAFHTAQQLMAEKYEPYFWGAFVLLE